MNTIDFFKNSLSPICAGLLGLSPVLRARLSENARWCEKVVGRASRYLENVEKKTNHIVGRIQHSDVGRLDIFCLGRIIGHGLTKILIYDSR